jgi:prepilin-type N-terminal cleavage/methylation domain-containing protein
MITMWRRVANQRGFTLTELLVATAVIAVVMAGVFVIQQQSQQAYLFGASRVETQQNARVALDLMTRELRTANPGGAAPTGIVSIPSASDITLRDQCGNNVEFALAGMQLNRRGPDYTDPSHCVCDGSCTNTTRLVVGGVTSLTMTYYSVYDVSSGTYTTTTDATKVKVVKVGIETQTEQDVASGSAGDQHATMESTITLRATLS